MKKFDTTNLEKSERDRIISNPDLYRRHIRNHLGGLESSMIDSFYDVTSKHPEKRSFGDIFRVDFVYSGPLFGKNKANLAIYPLNDNYDSILEHPELYMKAYDYDSQRKLYLMNNEEISISNQLEIDEEKVLPIKILRESIYFESRVLDLFEKVIKAGKK